MARLRLLIVALDNWYGSARLPCCLGRAGFEVGLLAPPGIFAAQSRGVDRLFPLAPEGTPHALERPGWLAIEAFAPDFIVPGDEKSVRLLAFMATSRSAPTSPGVRSMLLRSLPSRPSLLGRDAMTAIAADAGLTCPEHAAVRSLDEALRVAERMGWPVYLKRDNTAGGNGVRQCGDRAALAVQFAQLTRTDMSPWSAEGTLRRGRQWLRSLGIGGDPGITIQAAIPGAPAFHTAVALDGKWLAGISADVEEFHPRPTGPSTRVRLHGDPAMDDLARRLIAALGYNGFCGLDFIRRPDGGLTFLEFNARPTPVAHLGKLVGTDLGVALHAALSGEPVAAPLPALPQRVALFPQDWLRDPHSAGRAGCHLDIPTDDPALLEALGALLPKGWDDPGLRSRLTPLPSCG
ncbi:MAG: hypothetical protein AB7F22_20890 [Reyranella sp.]|uniref:ATP-binding protein n=1 Tax=Reyranella sp. TaxID=1929291 RepID=UPI003D0F66E5